MRPEISLIALPLVLSGVWNFRSNTHQVVEKTSRIDGKKYKVRKDVDDPQISADVLAEIRKRLEYLLTFLDPETNPYHLRLVKRFKYTVLKENPLKRPLPTMTSYSINKGEEIVICLRHPNTESMHDIDTLMYVLIHEAAHIACPEVGHTRLFIEIFSDLLRIAVNQAKVIHKTDYRSSPVQYCGMTISEKLV